MVRIIIACCGGFTYRTISASAISIFLFVFSSGAIYTCACRLKDCRAWWTFTIRNACSTRKIRQPITWTNCALTISLCILVASLLARQAQTIRKPIAFLAHALAHTRRRIADRCLGCGAIAAHSSIYVLVCAFRTRAARTTDWSCIPRVARLWRRRGRCGRGRRGRASSRLRRGRAGSRLRRGRACSRLWRA